MNPKELLFGTNEEKTAHQTIKRFEGRQNLRPGQQTQLDEARGLTRRLFLRQAGTAIVSGGLIYTVYTATRLAPWPPFFAPASETLELATSPELQILAWEVRAWTLVDGSKMTQLFPEIESYAAILAGEVNLQSFIPYVKPRLYFSNDTDDPRLNTTLTDPDETLSTRAQIKIPAGSLFTGGAELNFKWLDKKTNSATIKLTPEVQKSSIRIPIILKEVSQIYDAVEYYKTYLQLAYDQGVEFTVLNPESVSPSQAEIEANVAENLGFTEKSITGDQVSFLDTLIDFGAHIRVGGIMFANWYQDQLNRGLTPPETSIVRYSKNMVSLLESNGVISREGNRWGWTKSSSAPAINTPLFIELVKAISQHPGPRFR